MREIIPGDVIQLTETAQEGWIGCLMVVSEVLSWGVMAYITLPMQGDAYLRVKTGQFEIVGRAVLVRSDEETSE